MGDTTLRAQITQFSPNPTVGLDAERLPNPASIPILTLLRWARHTPFLSPSERLVLMEIADLDRIPSAGILALDFGISVVGAELAVDTLCRRRMIEPQADGGVILHTERWGAAT